MIWGSGGSKSRLAKAAGAEPSGQMRDEKLRAVVARSTCPSQNVQSTPGSDHVWQLGCRKSARRCGVKHISKSKSTKHTMLGPRWKTDWITIRDLETTIWKLRFGNYGWVTNNLCFSNYVSPFWKLWFGNCISPIWKPNLRDLITKNLRFDNSDLGTDIPRFGNYRSPIW